MKKNNKNIILLKRVTNKIQLSPRLKALTFVETLVTLIIISTVLITMSVVLTTVIRTSYTSDARLNIRQNSEFAQEVFRRYVKSADPTSISCPNDEPSDTFDFRLAENDTDLFRFTISYDDNTELYRLYLIKNPDTNPEIQVLTYRDVDIDLYTVPNGDTYASYFLCQNVANRYYLISLTMRLDSVLEFGENQPVVDDVQTYTSVEIR